MCVIFILGVNSLVALGVISHYRVHEYRFRSPICGLWFRTSRRVVGIRRFSHFGTLEIGLKWMLLSSMLMSQRHDENNEFRELGVLDHAGLNWTNSGLTISRSLGPRFEQIGSYGESFFLVRSRR